MGVKIALGSDSVSRRILLALGLEPSNVRDFSLHFPMQEAASIEIDRVLSLEEVKSIRLILQQEHIEVGPEILEDDDDEETVLADDGDDPDGGDDG